MLVLLDALCKACAIGQTTKYTKFYEAAYKCMLPTDDDVPILLNSVNDVGMLRKGFAGFVDSALAARTRIRKAKYYIASVRGGGKCQTRL